MNAINQLIPKQTLDFISVTLSPQPYKLPLLQFGRSKIYLRYNLIYKFNYSPLLVSDRPSRPRWSSS
jgi:hypothetical protein